MTHVISKRYSSTIRLFKATKKIKSTSKLNLRLSLRERVESGKSGENLTAVTKKAAVAAKKVTENRRRRATKKLTVKKLRKESFYAEENCIDGKPHFGRLRK